MFVFPFAPGKVIALDYFVENVSLYHKGLSQIIIDLLITNKSDTKIDRLYLLFPHRVQNVNYDEKADRFEYLPLGHFKDLTDTFLIENSEYNKFCLPVTKINPCPPRNPNCKTVIVDTPNLLSPFINVQYIGDIRDKSSISLLEDLHPYKTKILHDIDFSVFTCSFQTPISYNEARWVRWGIHPDNIAKENYSRSQYLRKWLTNDITLRYEIYGPINIKELFISRLECFIAECRLQKDNNALEQHAAELRELIVNKGFYSDKTNTIVSDCRLHVFARDFQEVNNIILTGDVNLGYSINSSKKKTVLHYKSGARNIRYYYDGLFTIKFEVKHRSKIISLLPIISFMLAILGLILRFLT